MFPTLGIFVDHVYYTRPYHIIPDYTTLNHTIPHHTTLLLGSGCLRPRIIKLGQAATITKPGTQQMWDIQSASAYIENAISSGRRHFGKEGPKASFWESI